MWTSTMELSLERVIPTQLMGRFWRGAYFSSFAPLQVQNLPRQPLPATNWVRVRNRLAGISGSDLRLVYVDGDFRSAPAAIPGHSGHIGFSNGVPPRVPRFYPGHEVVGEVIEVGEHVQQLRVGDRVVLQSDPNCLSVGIQPPCRSCVAGNYNLCEGGILRTPHPFGGGWSEEMLLHEQQLFRVPQEMSDEQAVLLEPSAVAVHAALRRLPRPGDRTLIIGTGTIGLLILQVLRGLVPQSEISVAARYPFQIEQATRMGATHILYPQDSSRGTQRTTAVQSKSNQMALGSYDVIYDTNGSQQTIHQALRSARAGAAVVIVGLSLHMMHIDLAPIWSQQIDLIGTFGHGMETWPIGTQERHSTFAIATDMIQSCRGLGQAQPLQQLITHRFPLSDYRNALTIAADKATNRAIKVVFDYSLQPASVVPNVRNASQRYPATENTRRNFVNGSYVPQVGNPADAVPAFSVGAGASPALGPAYVAPATSADSTSTLAKDDDTIAILKLVPKQYPQEPEWRIAAAQETVKAQTHFNPDLEEGTKA